MRAVKFLSEAVRSYEPYLQDDGELCDPHFGEPTQYGTPYYALCNAVLATRVEGLRRSYSDQAVRGLAASLKHVADPTLPATLAHFSREDGSAGRMNHRDFFWPAILKTYGLLRGLKASEVVALGKSIAAVDIAASFRTRPPSNWAAVWLSGEWLRMREGLSPYSLEQFDAWLGLFFEHQILLAQGFFQEPGHPNSYDLFTRYHLADILQEGYRGRWRDDLETLLATGLKRSLAVQLSDGSLASAHRSTGQTWTLGAQCAYFTHAANYFRERDHELYRAANSAADLAFGSLERWQRPNGEPFSPVENCLPAAYRIGYEPYTADGHYANLALGFLAVAILNGFEVTPQAPISRPPSTYIEADPTYRAIAHHGPYSVHVNAFPAPSYDTFGLIDLTFGPGRLFHLVGSVKHVQSERLYNLGLACRNMPGHSQLEVLAHQEFALLRGFELGDTPSSLRLEARPKGKSYTYRLTVEVALDGVHITEATPGHQGYQSLLIPYLRDGGMGVTTEVIKEPAGVTFRHGKEAVRISLTSAIEGIMVLPYGYEGRRGLCGLVRIDVKDPSEGITYQIATVA